MDVLGGGKKNRHPVKRKKGRGKILLYLLLRMVQNIIYYVLVFNWGLNHAKICDIKNNHRRFTWTYSQILQHKPEALS